MIRNMSIGQRLAINARQANQLAAQASDVAARGFAVVAAEVRSLAQRTAASLEQGTGIAQVSETIVAMDETTQQNAALVEEAAAAAASMQEQAQRLARAVSVFKLQTTSPDAQAQTPGDPQLARSNQALAAA